MGTTKKKVGETMEDNRYTKPSKYREILRENQKQIRYLINKINIDMLATRPLGYGICHLEEYCGDMGVSYMDANERLVEFLKTGESEDHKRLIELCLESKEMLLRAAVNETRQIYETAVGALYRHLQAKNGGNPYVSCGNNE